MILQLVTLQLVTLQLVTLQLTLFQRNFFKLQFLRLRLSCLLIGSVWGLAWAQSEQPAVPTPGGLTAEYNSAFYVLSELNTGLPATEPSPNLQTPQATMEFFLREARAENYLRAAHALNLNLLSQDRHLFQAPGLVEQLLFLLENKGLIDFDNLPDRPDGQIDPVPGSTNPLIGSPRRSIELGQLDLSGRVITLRLQRVQVAESAPVWVFSANTTDNIAALYDAYGPNAIDRALPDWLRVKVFGIALWEYIALAVLVGIVLLVGWLIGKLSQQIINWLGDGVLTNLIDQLMAPLTLTIAFGILFAVTSGLLPFTEALIASTRPITWILLIVSLMWLGIRTINYFAERYKDMQIDNLDEEAKQTQRRRQTMLSIGRRVFIFFSLLIGIGVMLGQFADLEALGTTLLTSAGIAGAIIGIAAQPTLGNIIAGIQVAITQPVRIGDTVIIDGNWSSVEDLRYTYAVVKTWDERRLIVPMRELVTETIENWTHTDTHQSTPVYLYVDYDTDVEAIRDKFISLVKASDLWCGEQEPELLVTEVLEDRVKLRGKLSGKNSSDAWSLSCSVREDMVRYLSELKQGQYLPRERVAVQDSSSQNRGSQNGVSAYQASD